MPKKSTISLSINPESANSHISTEDPASATIDVVAVEVPELTEQEQSDGVTAHSVADRLHLERKVERAFFEALKALAELRDGLRPALSAIADYTVPCTALLRNTARIWRLHNSYCDSVTPFILLQVPKTTL